MDAVGTGVAQTHGVGSWHSGTHMDAFDAVLRIAIHCGTIGICHQMASIGGSVGAIIPSDVACSGTLRGETPRFGGENAGIKSVASRCKKSMGRGAGISHRVLNAYHATSIVPRCLRDTTFHMYFNHIGALMTHNLSCCIFGMGTTAGAIVRDAFPTYHQFAARILAIN